MQYLFFDIECANCFDGTGKICEFGYVLTDEAFNIIREENIVINPGAPFDKKGFAISKIKLAYPYSTYYKAEKFPKRYGEIRALLTAKDCVVVGHGVKSDVKFISDDCRRYGLKLFDYEFTDTERLVSVLTGREKRLRLVDIHNDFYPEREHTQRHEGLDDALMTMEIARYLAEHEGKPFHELVGSIPAASGEVFMERVVDKATVFRYTDGERMSARNRDIFHEFVAENQAKNKRGLTYTLPLEYEKTHFPQMLKIVDTLNKRGYRYSTSSHGGKYVSFDKGEARLKSFKKSAVIRWNDFLSDVGLTEADLDYESIDLFSLIADMDCNREWYAQYKKKHGL